jgi:hypothetical protein
VTRDNAKREDRFHGNLVSALHGKASKHALNATVIAPVLQMQHAKNRRVRRRTGPVACSAPWRGIHI